MTTQQLARLWTPAAVRAVETHDVRVPARWWLVISFDLGAKSTATTVTRRSDN